MLEDLNEIHKFTEKYATGDYICVVENRFGGGGYFIKEGNSEFKENWNYTLIHKKHEEILKSYLKDTSVVIFICVQDSVYLINSDFIETYDERRDYKIMETR